VRRLTDYYVALAEKRGAELGVTLTIGGTVVSGYLTPSVHYANWIQEQVETKSAGGNTTFPEAVPLQTQVEMQQAIRYWHEQHSDDRAGADATQTVSSNDDFPFFTLRNATVIVSRDMVSRHAFLRVNADEVGSVALGRQVIR
jgi:hypothetical protein